MKDRNVDKISIFTADEMSTDEDVMLRFSLHTKGCLKSFLFFPPCLLFEIERVTSFLFSTYAAST